jgi:hypothetical protein
MAVSSLGMIADSEVSLAIGSSCCDVIFGD